MSKIYAWYFFENRIKCNTILFTYTGRVNLYGDGEEKQYKNSRVVVVNVFVFQKTKIVPIIVVCNNKKIFRQNYITASEFALSKK